MQLKPFKRHDAFFNLKPGWEHASAKVILPYDNKWIFNLPLIVEYFSCSEACPYLHFNQTRQGGNMRMTICFLLASAMPFMEAHSQAHHRDHAAAALEQCGEYSQAGMRDCLERKVRESSKALAEAEARAQAAIRRWDEEPKFITAATEKLAASGRGFLTYRAEHCAFAASLGGGAIHNALELRRLACVFAMNSSRSQELTRIAAELPPK